MRLAFALAMLIAVEAAPGWAVPPPEVGRPELRMRFVNSSADGLSEIYACPTGSSDCGKNLLGSRTLGPGRRITLRVPGVCGAYDLRLVAADGKTEYLEEGLELCSASAAREAARAIGGAQRTAGEDEEDVVIVGGGALTHGKSRSRH